MFCDDGRNGQMLSTQVHFCPNNLGPLYQPSCVGVFYRFAENPDIRADQISKLQLARSVFLMLATSCFFFSISKIGLAEATAIMDVNPVLITLGAAFLGEK